jgi:predicted AAA+ superfamily ATPase
MQSFFNIHNNLVEKVPSSVRRGLMDDINWNHRLIGIKGARGIGKTTFLLSYARQFLGDKSYLYVDLNDLYFSERSIVSFADEFRKTGGKTLILDQIYKYPAWSEELRYCYDNFKELQIIFAGSPVMRLKDANPHLRGCAKAYSLDGFSFREFINLSTGEQFQKYTLDQIISNHETICHDIVSKVRPLAYFADYLNHGYYPYFLNENSPYESMLKTINLVLEIDISYLQQIEHKYLPKLRKLLYQISCQAPFQPNVSKLSVDVETSRATIMNYLSYLKQARLIHLLFNSSDTGMKKPTQIYMQNPNLMFIANYGTIDTAMLHKTFFYNQLAYQNNVTAGKTGDFCVNNDRCFKVGIESNNRNNLIEARDMIEIGKGNVIPLWLFGFLY